MGVSLLVHDSGSSERVIHRGIRTSLEPRAGTMPVHLDLRVKVVKDWQSDAKQLNRLGF
jgi:GTP-binding protein Era